MPARLSSALRRELRKAIEERDRWQQRVRALEAALVALEEGRVPGRRRPMDSAERQAVSKRMRAYWADRRRQAGERSLSKRS